MRRRCAGSGPPAVAAWRCGGSSPGVRVYTTLAAGASGMPLRRFLVGAMPALVVWLGALVTVGDLVGRPAEAVISRVDELVLTGALLIVLGFGSFVVVRRVPRGRIEEDHMSGVPRSPRVVLALADDLGIVAATIAGVDSIAGHFPGAAARAERRGDAERRPRRQLPRGGPSSARGDARRGVVRRRLPRPGRDGARQGRRGPRRQPPTASGDLPPSAATSRAGSRRR